MGFHSGGFLPEGGTACYFPAFLHSGILYSGPSPPLPEFSEGEPAPNLVYLPQDLTDAYLFSVPAEALPGLRGSSDNLSGSLSDRDSGCFEIGSVGKLTGR